MPPPAAGAPVTLFPLIVEFVHVNEPEYVPPPFAIAEATMLFPLITEPLKDRLTLETPAPQPLLEAIVLPLIVEADAVTFDADMPPPLA
jgi:hypothetical protein